MEQLDAKAGAARRLVIKIGSSTLTTSESSIDYEYLAALADQIAKVRAAGWQPVIVTSAAIACGLEALGIQKRPSDMPSLQAAASVGQSALATAYAEVFAAHGIVTSTVLLTRRDTADRHAYLHARNTLLRLLELGVVPIINENDAVATDEIGVENTIGENDTLSAIVAAAVGADLLILLSDIDGLYDSDPHKNPEAKLISTVGTIDDSILALGGGSGSALGTGGMATKLHAAQVATAAGCEMVIANGQRPELLYDIAAGKPVGTRFLAKEGK